MAISFNSKKMAVYILLALGAILITSGLILGIKVIDIKIFNLLVGITLVIFGLFTVFGKYKYERSSRENQDAIKQVAIETKINTEKANAEINNLREESKLLSFKNDALIEQNKNLKIVLDEQTKKMDLESQIRESKHKSELKSSIRRYRELVDKYTVVTSSMGRLNFVEFDINKIRDIRYSINLTINEILQNSFVSSNETVYSEWQLIRNNILIFLSFYNLPNGLMTNEDDKSFEITNEIKKEKFMKLNKALLDSEIKLNLVEQDIKKRNGIED